MNSELLPIFWPSRRMRGGWIVRGIVAKELPGCAKIFTLQMREMLDIASGNAKIPLKSHLPEGFGRGVMNYIQPTNTTHSYLQSEAMSQTCRHPRVQVVSRDEDAEFVECLECREVFDSSEFRDMDIEAKIPTEEE